MLNLYKLAQGKRAEDTSSSDKKTFVNTPGRLRVQTDFDELEAPSNVKVIVPNKEDLMNFNLSIVPDEGYWKGATILFSLQIPDNYPHKPPKVMSDTKIYHPNINLEGNVCLNILRNDWRPILNIQNVIHGLIYLFLEPNPDDPLNQEAAAVLRKDKALFRQYVDASLRGRQVQGVDFTRNETIKN